MQIALPFDETSTIDASAGAEPSPAGVSTIHELAVIGDAGNQRRLVLIRHPRARRYVIRVREDGSVRVTIPRRGSNRGAREFAERERGWIDRQFRRLAEQRACQAVATLGPEERQSLIELARSELPARLLALAALSGLSVARISVRNQRSRWGSCSRSGRICLNWRLVRMPGSVRDYVMIHELMHLRQMNHSPRFWKLVAKACPGYREARAWLRRHGDAISADRTPAFDRLSCRPF